MKPAPAIVVLALLMSSAASAQEAITTAPAGSPPAGEATPSLSPLPAPVEKDRSPEAIGRWARGVLAGEPAQSYDRTATPPETKSGCVAPIDRAPHGEVHAGVGTGGYREIGGTVTKPIGDCGRVTISVNKAEMDAPRRRERR